eukprot:TRINITY_DN2744_c4_g1_i1.p2 TRINITY_DN2744_c4_g1~~TRINITY_DN2744_c4_g1_i1.p2  ORF type:complete len:255 (+),score=65.75 TRINITY_DN2744_c4_g1_i1:74-838(+)
MTDQWAESAEQFIAENELDEESANLLREQPVDLQQYVIRKGGVKDVRNPLAVIRARIRESGSSGGPLQPWNPDGNGKYQGTVKLWHAAKGYGFVVNDATGEEIFCYHGDIGGRSLEVGGKITFDITPWGDGKRKCTNVTGAVGPRIDARGKPVGAKGKGGGGGGGELVVQQGKGMAGKGKAGKGGYAPYQEEFFVRKGGKGKNAAPLWAEAEVYVTLPLEHTPGRQVQFCVGGATYQIQPPPGVYAGECFSVEL